jgi:predicted permease
MRTLRAWLVRCLSLFASGRHERELQQELEAHLQLHADANERAGMSPADARRTAMLRLGSLEATKDAHRDRQGIPLLQHLGRDARLAVRTLRRSPSFTGVAVLTLALGIGANASVFTLVNAVLLRPLPYPEPERLVMLWSTDSTTGDREGSISYPDFEAWRSARGFESLAAFTTRAATLGGERESEFVPAVQASAEFFQVLGISASSGRLFDPEDERLERRVAVLADAAWRQHFGGRSDVVGSTVLINQVPHTVIGTIPPGVRFQPSDREQVYTLLPRETNRGHIYLRVVGRLAAGSSLEAAQAEMDAVAARLSAEFPGTNRDKGASLVPLQTALGAPARLPLVILSAIVAAVLLIACTNVANLLLARNASRGHELSLRVALGAGRGRIFQQLLVESLVLAAAGGVLGLMVAQATTAALVMLLVGVVPVTWLEGIRTDGTVLAYTVGLAMGTGLFFGVVPAWAATPFLVPGSSRDSSRSVAGGRGGRRTRATLVVIETALALILLAAGGVIGRKFIELRTTAPGFAPDAVAVVAVRLPGVMSPGAPRAAFFEEVRARVLAMPNVSAAGFVANLPMTGGRDSLGFRLVEKPGEKPSSANFNIASPGYFAAMGIPVRTGREFTSGDTASAPPAIVINETAARRLWPDQNPMGRQIVLVGRTEPLTVVGVTGDVRQSDLGTAPRPEIYLSALQPGPDWPSFVLVAAVSQPSPSLIADLRASLRGVNRDVAIARTGTMVEVLALSLAQPRIYSALLGAFAAIAVVLAAVGLYGVISYSVSQRTREIGVRMALGSSPRAIVGSVLRQGLVLAVIGITLGLAGASAATRMVATLLPGTRPGDAAMLSAVAALMLLVAALACYLPARRASRVDPLIALRAE